MTNLINGRTPEEIKQELQWLAYGCPESEPECCECVHAEICSGLTKRSAPCDALALIENLEAQQPKWISVKEQEPVFPCLCWDGVNAPDVAKNLVVITLKDGKKVFVKDVFLEVFPEALQWLLEDCTHILYWMPLPELPKEDADE
jgi:hypothetical protein